MVKKVTLTKTLYAGGVVMDRQVDQDIPASEVNQRKNAYVNGIKFPELTAGMTAQFAVSVGDKPLGSQTYSFGRQRFMPSIPNSRRAL